MVKNNKKAFTIIEMIMAMFIIGLAMMAVTPMLTQSKPDIKKTTIKGQYACWRDNAGQLHQLRCDERACPPLEDIASNTLISSSTDYCTFELDNRPAHFSIIAIGSGGSPGVTNDARAIGQTKTSQNPVISNSLKIEIPCAYGCGPSDYSPTVIYSDSASAEIVAGSGGGVLSNGLAPDNIKACHMLSAGTCRNSSQRPEGCAVVNTAISGTQQFEKQIQIIGCDSINEYGDIEPELIPFDALQTNFTIEDAGATATNSSIIPGVNPEGEQYSLVYTPNISGYDVYQMAFDLLDSSYTTQKQTIAETQNHNTGAAYRTMLKKILLFAIPRDRNSTLIQFLINNDFGNLGNNGAVLILW